MESFLFEKTYRIPVYDTGPDGKLSLYSLFNYLQDIASEHAVRLKFGREDLIKANRIWVLSRIVADIAVRPQWEESIVVRTWPRGTDNIFAIRDYEVHYTDGRHIASGSSSWLIVDLTTKKIQRPDEILTRFNTDIAAKSSLGRNAGKVESSLAVTGDSSRFKVSVSDLDVNLHTNNVRYINWITDTYDLNFIMGHSPHSIEVNYLAESVWGDEVFIRSGKASKDNSYIHSVMRSTDNKELCRIRVDWENCAQ